MLPEFEGPLDLLLHLIKKSDIDIYDVQIEDIVKQYMAYIEAMEILNLSIASEYLVMASELMEMKSRMLLPRSKIDEEDVYEENPREVLIRRLLEYERYKKVTSEFEKLEEERSSFYTKEVSDFREFKSSNEPVLVDATLSDLMDAFTKFLSRQENLKPLHTKVTQKEYSVSKRSLEIRSILRERKKIFFGELFTEFNRGYVVVTFLSILDMARKQELVIEQDNNFNDICLSLNGVI